MKTTISILIIYSLICGSASSRSGEHKLLLSPENNKRALIQRIYTAELGVKEKTGKNDGPRVEQYLRQVGLKRGDPWCAAFVCWVFDQAGVANPRTGWSPGLFPKGKLIWERKEVVGGRVAGEKVAGAVAGEKVAVGRKAVKSLPQRGDVFGIWFPEKNRIAHAGFVDRWDKSWLITVEGNTNEAGSREGDGVLRKRRLVRSVYQVVKWVIRE